MKKAPQRSAIKQMMVDTPSVFHATMYPSRKGQAPAPSQIEKNVPLLTGNKKEFTDA